MSQSVPRGRLKSKPVAEFGYDLRKDQHRGLDDSDRAQLLRVISDCSIQFYQLDAETRSNKTFLQKQRDYERHEWSVGIAYRTFDMVPDALSNSQTVSTKFAHWGVYIKRDGEPYKIFGMNFASFDKKELIIEDVWAANTNHGSEWRRELDINDFTKHEDPDYRDLTMYFSEIEFILAAQLVLDKFGAAGLDNRYRPFAPSPSDLSYNALTRDNSGETYGLIQNNCQKFAAQLIQFMHEKRWDEERRQSRPFQLNQFEPEIRSAFQDFTNSAQITHQETQIRMRNIAMSTYASEAVEFYPSAAYEQDEYSDTHDNDEYSDTSDTDR